LPQASLQFICKKCRSLSDVRAFEQARDGTFFCLCPNCKSKNAVMQTGATLSQPGIVQVTRLID
jgi:Zn finger protein HypA/HybF involved in hydrogenase expression